MKSLPKAFYWISLIGWLVACIERIFTPMMMDGYMSAVSLTTMFIVWFFTLAFILSHYHLED